MSTSARDRVFEDHYETLQLSPNADHETIDRVYRVLVRRYHPDNQDTGNPETFDRVVCAYRTLSDPDRRASYDVKFEENRSTVLQIFEESSNPEGHDGDRRIFDGILSLLYICRRRDADQGGMGVVQMDRMLACPAKHLEF